MTITGHLTVVAPNAEEYARILAETQANAAFSNIVFDEQACTISFEVNINDA